jgi:hypothetical protein
MKAKIRRTHVYKGYVTYGISVPKALVDCGILHEGTEYQVLLTPTEHSEKNSGAPTQRPRVSGSRPPAKPRFRARGRAH